MAALTLTAEDSSALIHYDPAGAWTNPKDDPLSQSYSGASFHSTSVQGATATIQFNGTGINIYAANRPDYGSFQLTVDGNVVSQGQAAAASPEFKKVIATSTGLANGPHTAILENTSQSTIDLDMVELVTEFGPPGSQLNTTTYDDTNPAIIYEPAAEWNRNTAQGFMNNTLHWTNKTDATFSLSWEGGEGFAIWTTAAPDHRDFKLELDGQIVADCKGGANGLTSGLRVNLLMHYQTGLGPGSHQLKLTGGDNGPYLDLDSINIYSTTGGSPGSTDGTSPSASSTSSTLSTGVIAAIAGGAVAFMLCILVMVIFFVRRRRGRQPGSSSTDGRGEKSLNLNLEIGPGRPVSFEKPQYGGPPPLSTTSSFFTLERSSKFPPNKLATYPESTDSGSSMPAMPPGVGQYPRQSAGSFGPTDWTVETPSTGGNTHRDSDRAPRDNDIQSLRATVLYPSGVQSINAM
jgi:hypothetical protein